MHYRASEPPLGATGSTHRGHINSNVLIGSPTPLLGLLSHALIASRTLGLQNSTGLTGLERESPACQGDAGGLELPEHTAPCYKAPPLL